MVSGEDRGKGRGSWAGKGRGRGSRARTLLPLKIKGPSKALTEKKRSSLVQQKQSRRTVRRSRESAPFSQYLLLVPGGSTVGSAHGLQVDFVEYRVGGPKRVKVNRGPRRPPRAPSVAKSTTNINFLCIWEISYPPPHTPLHPYPSTSP